MSNFITNTNDVYQTVISKNGQILLEDGNTSFGNEDQQENVTIAPYIPLLKKVQSIAVGGTDANSENAFMMIIAFNTNNEPSCYARGYNGGRQLGTGSTAGYVEQFTEISQYRSGGNNTDSNRNGYKHGAVYAKQVSCGTNHSLILLTSGRVLSCGLNIRGQLGLKKIKDKVHQDDPNEWENTEYSYPQIVAVNQPFYDDTNAAYINAGGNTSLLITNTGTLLTWGDNEFNNAGIINTTNDYTLERDSYGTSFNNRNDLMYIFYPYNINLGKRVTKAVLAQERIMILCSDNNLMASGVNQYGQCGDGTQDSPITSPKDITSQINGKNIYEDIIDIAVSYNTSYLLTSSGTIYSTGDPSDATLGRSSVSVTSHSKFTRLDTTDSDNNNLEYDGTNAKQIGVSRYTLNVLTSSGKLLVCGKNLYGLLGSNKDSTDSASFGGIQNVLKPINTNQNYNGTNGLLLSSGYSVSCYFLVKDNYLHSGTSVTTAFLMHLGLYQNTTYDKIISRLSGATNGDYGYQITDQADHNVAYFSQTSDSTYTTLQDIEDLKVYNNFNNQTFIIKNTNLNTADGEGEVGFGKASTNLKLEKKGNDDKLYGGEISGYLLNRGNNEYNSGLVFSTKNDGFEYNMITIQGNKRENINKTRVRLGERNIAPSEIAHSLEIYDQDTWQTSIAMFNLSNYNHFAINLTGTGRANGNKFLTEFISTHNKLAPAGTEGLIMQIDNETGNVGIGTTASSVLHFSSYSHTGSYYSQFKQRVLFTDGPIFHFKIEEYQPIQQNFLVAEKPAFLVEGRMDEFTVHSSFFSIGQNGKVGIGTSDTGKMDFQISKSWVKENYAVGRPANVQIGTGSNHYLDYLYLGGGTTNQRKLALISRPGLHEWDELKDDGQPYPWHEQTRNYAYCRSDLHFCMNSIDSNDDVTLLDTKMILTNGGSLIIGKNGLRSYTLNNVSNLEVWPNSDTNTENASITIGSNDEKSDNRPKIYFSTTYMPTPGYAPKKTAIIAEGVNHYSSSKLHFCLSNAANNENDVTLADSYMTIVPGKNQPKAVGIGTTDPQTSNNGGLEVHNGRIRISGGSVETASVLEFARPSDTASNNINWIYNTNSLADNGQQLDMNPNDLIIEIGPNGKRGVTNNQGIARNQVRIWKSYLTIDAGEAQTSSNPAYPLLRFRAPFANYPADVVSRPAADIVAGYRGVWSDAFLTFNVGPVQGITGNNECNLCKEVMVIDGQGRVGIGSNYPAYMLDVKTYGARNGYPGTNHVKSLGSGYKYFSADAPSYGTIISPNDTAISIRGSNFIYGEQGVLAASDERIKENIIDVKDSSALQQVRDISCVTYQYKDKLLRGNDTTIGFIAQQVKEHLPIAISLTKSIIPNEMRLIQNPEWTQITDGSNNKFKLTIPDLEDMSGNTKYRFYMSNDISGNDECEKEISSLTEEPKSFIFDQSWNNVFLYGKEVDDFHTLDKQKLFALNFSATQEIDRIQQKQVLDISLNKIDIETTQLDLTEAKAKIATLETELAALKAVVQQLVNAQST